VGTVYDVEQGKKIMSRGKLGSDQIMNTGRKSLSTGSCLHKGTEKKKTTVGVRPGPAKKGQGNVAAPKDEKNVIEMPEEKEKLHSVLCHGGEKKGPSGLKRARETASPRELGKGGNIQGQGKGGCRSVLKEERCQWTGGRMRRG